MNNNELSCDWRDPHDLPPPSSKRGEDGVWRQQDPTHTFHHRHGFQIVDPSGDSLSAEDLAMLETEDHPLDKKTI